MVSVQLRGVALAALSALLTTIGHAAAGGGLPDVSVLVVVVPLLAAAFVALAERTHGPLATLLVLGAGQLVLHLTLAALHPMPAGNGIAMLGCHAVITLITAVAIRYADAAVLAVAAALRRVVPRRLTPPCADRPLPTCAVPAPDLPARRARMLTVADVRRGPPVWA